jgi:putative transposase
MKAYKYRIYPNAQQAERLSQHFGCVRFVYNWALAEKDRAYKATGKGLSKREVQDRFVHELKKEKTWLTDVNSQSLLAALGHLHTAFTNFFAGRAKFPNFKKKSSGWQSFQCPQHVRVNFDNGVIDLPKIPGIKARLHRRFDLDHSKIKTVTIKRSPAGHYFASVLVETDAMAPTPSVIEQDKTLGIDLGLQHYLIDSNGSKTPNPRFLRKSLHRLGIEQKKLARLAKGGKNRQKQRSVVAKKHAQIANQRLDFLHQLTHQLVYKNHATSYAVEDLHIKGMVKNRTLAKSIQDASWGLFLKLLDYKCIDTGKNVLKIGRFEPSSKRCNHCHHRMETMPLDVRVWDCPSCGTQGICRDTNAARNIRDIGLADALGKSVYVKRSHTTSPVSAGVVSKGAELLARHGSYEAPTRTAPAV